MEDLLVSGLTELVTPDEANDYYPVWDTSAAELKKTKIQMPDPGYQMTAEIWNCSPADSKTYYFGSFPSKALTESGSVRPVWFEKAGTITRVHLWYLVSGTPSAENSTLYLRKNHATDTTLTTTLALNASGNTVVTGLSVTVAAGDFFEIKWVTPAWTTNPTGLDLQAVILVE